MGRAVEHGYYTGPNEARARGLVAPPGGAVFPPSVLEAHPLPLSEGATVDAYANFGRWVADCPFCSGAEVVTAAMPVFWCDSCGMAELNGQAVRVAFPPDLDEIDDALARRPRPHRNYRPGEITSAFPVSVAEWLRAENVVHGFVPSTVVQRLEAKAIYWGPWAVMGELETANLIGDRELERRYHDPPKLEVPDWAV